MSYFGVSKEYLRLTTILFILLIGFINYFGPKHSGSVAITLALPMVMVVVAIIALSLPHLTFAHLEAPRTSFSQNWVSFVGVILALSGVEAIANLTGVMKLDAAATLDTPSVGSTARKAIWPVAAEVVLGTALLGWAMLSLPRELAPQIQERWQDMLRFLGEYYAGLMFGGAVAKVIGVFVGVVVGLLLLSAVNTATAAMIGLLYMLASDREMPQAFARLNRHGVPWLSLAMATGLPLVLVLLADDLHSLADMYAIGVVGAITIDLGSCCFNKRIGLNWSERALMFSTFLILFAVEVTIAKTKPAALFFATCVLGVGFGLRWFAMKHAGFETLIVAREVAAAVRPDLLNQFRPNLSPGQSILVAARGLTPVLRYALEEAKLRQGNLYVLYVKEVAVNLSGTLPTQERPRWQDDPRAAEIMYNMLELCRQDSVPVLPLYTISESPAAAILDLAATFGVDILMLGAPHRRSLVQLLKGNVVTEVANSLPENIQLVIHG
jgi:nucleotide-binding universal stress UspA family protein